MVAEEELPHEPCQHEPSNHDETHVDEPRRRLAEDRESGEPIPQSPPIVPDDADRLACVAWSGQEVSCEALDELRRGGMPELGALRITERRVARVAHVVEEVVGSLIGVTRRAVGRAALDATDVDLEVFEIGTVWRCMDSKVYAFNVGANLPCLAKADESQEPQQPLIDYCAENPDSDFIPAVVTGRETVYSWACEDGEPVVVEQFTEVDSQGFLEFVWYELQKPQRESHHSSH